MIPSRQSKKIFRRHPKIDPSTRRWLNKYPVLKGALTRAQKRFGDLPGVLGLGIGRKYHESKKKYGAAPINTGGFCIKVLVERKKATLPQKEKIPRSLRVTIPGEKASYQVLIDVVALARSGEKLGSHKKLQEGRGWPTAGVVTPGRLFAFGRGTTDEYGMGFTKSQQVRLGTTGVVIKTRVGDYYAVSAGHVFAEPCQKDTDRPKGLRAVGVKDRSFIPVEGDEFFPSSIEDGGVISDVIGYRVPSSVLPEEFSWPDGFTRELATQDDIERAILEEGKRTAFVWVERGEIDRPQAIPVDLELKLTGFKDYVNCESGSVDLEYGTSWGLLYTSKEKTMGGDSGAAVFVIAEDGFHCRLLGFHFLMSGGRSYAMDAKTFLEANFKNPQRELVFP